MLTPEDRARFAPPRDADGEVSVRKLIVSERASELAQELLDLLEDSSCRTRALGALQACAEWAYTGIDQQQAPPIVWVPVDMEVVHPAPVGTVLPPGASQLGLDLWVLGILHSGLHPLQRLVATVLAARADPLGHIPQDAQPNLHDLQRETGLVMADLHTALQDLDRRGWIVRHPNLTGGGTRRIRYALTMPRRNSR